MLLLRRCFFAFLLLAAVPLPAAGVGAAGRGAAGRGAAGDSGWFYRGSDLAPDPAWQFGTLANGLRYAVRRNPLPVGQVSIRVRIDAGSLNEADPEQGTAHFVEHMVFRGTSSFAGRDARHIWQQLGASFGSDTNASTDPTKTVYQLDLPQADRAALDKSLQILSEMVDKASFTPAAVDAERKVVLAEKGRRPELATRFSNLSRPLFFPGLKIAVRDTIGTDETLRAATPQSLSAFYERWYRPENATVVIVGDADPALLVELIAKRFGSWRPTGAAPPAPDYGTLAPSVRQVETLVYPGAPYSATLLWLRPHIDSPDTVARETDELAELLATQIVNRRLEAKARADASFIGAGVSIDRTRHVGDTTQLSITAREGHWREALNENFAIIGSALRARPSNAEIAREMSNLRLAFNSGVAGESTVKSPQRAQQLINALDDGDVVISAPAMLALFDRVAPRMTPARIAKATRKLFGGTGPRLLLVAPQPVDGGNAAVAAALAAAVKVAPAARQDERKISFDALPPLGIPGKEVSRQRIEDMDVTIVRFANGSTLTFKQTDYEKGSVSVRLRLGNGVSGLSPAVPSPLWMSGAVAPSGLADLDLDAMERLLTGRRIGMDVGVAEDALVLTGTTNAQDLPDQLRLLATKLAFPRWDAALFNRYKAGALENYELSFASAAARAGREIGAVTHPGDRRWLPIPKATIASAQPADLQRAFAPLLAGGPVEAIIVGDVDLESAAAAMAKTIGALPARPAPPPPAVTVPPRPNPKPILFSHEGDKDQAYALIGWSTFGGTARIRDRRALALAANIFQARLFDRLREEEGATYSPGANASSSESFPAWGIFVAAAEIRPESSATFFRIARELVADLAKRPVSADEFARAQNPVTSGLSRQVKTNGYWVSALEKWTTEPVLIEQTRRHISDYKGMTPEDVRAAVAAYVADEGDWSMLVLPEKAARKAPEAATQTTRDTSRPKGQPDEGRSGN
ncbi:MAG: insulinase family protein [Alphaproteobacteria bacterium]|nr:insulinase family protein [Alphaproteobacteria bacterium]